MKTFTNIYQIASDALAEDEIMDIIDYYTTYHQEEETDIQFDNLIDKERLRIYEEVLRKMADIIHTRRGVD